VKKTVKKQKINSRKFHKRSTTGAPLRKILIQSLTVLFISIIGESLTGTVLMGMREKLILIPGLLIIVPALTDLRGNVGAAFGERLSTMLHLGILKPRFAFSKIVKHNIFASFTLTASIALIIGFIAPPLSSIFHIKSSDSLTLSSISVIAAMTSSLILLPFVFVMVFYAFKHKIDPDNIVAPILPVVGDIITVSAIYFTATFIITAKEMLSKGLILFAAIIFLKGARFKSNRNTFPKRYRYFQILKQSFPILLICLSIGIGSGIFLQSADKTFDLFPLLLSLVPQVIAQGGSIGGIVGSRVSTALYLGNAKPFAFGQEVMKNLSAGIIMGLITGPLIGIVSFLMGIFTKTPLFQFYKIILISTLSLFILSLLMSIVAIFTAFLSFKVHLDPSNVVIPLITSMGDITGVIILITIVKFVLL